jgi:hypothetical protein
MNNYTKVSNQVLEDATLSLKAKGLFAYLVKLPEGWKIRIGEIAKHHKDGYDSVQSALNELRSAGYLERLGRSRDKGKVGDWEYRINASLAPDREKPVQENPVQVEPDKENPVQVDLPPAQVESAIAPDRENPNVTPPDREKPDKENPCVYIKDLEIKKEKINKKEKVADAKYKKPPTALPDLPDWLPEDLWSDFKELRTAMRIPLTPGAIKRNINKLKDIAEKYSVEHACFCLSETVANGWRGIPELEPHRARAATSPRFMSVEEKNRIAAEKFLNGDSDGIEKSDFTSAGNVERSYWESLQRKNANRLV